MGFGANIGGWTEQVLDNWMRQRLNLPGNFQQAIALAIADATVPSGTVFFTAAASAPDGYLLADGSAVSETTYATLRAAIGTSFNDGSEALGEFRLPDLRGRAPYGKGTHADVNALGDSDGLAVGARKPGHTHSHSHTHSIAHAHDYSGVTEEAEFVFSSGFELAEGAYSQWRHTHEYSGTTGSADPFTSGAASVAVTDSSAPAYVTLFAIIKT